MPLSKGHRLVVTGAETLWWGGGTAKFAVEFHDSGPKNGLGHFFVPLVKIRFGVPPVQLEMESLLGACVFSSKHTPGRPHVLCRGVESQEELF